MFNSLKICLQRDILNLPNPAGLLASFLTFDNAANKALHTSSCSPRSFFGIPASWKQAKLREKKALIRNHEYGIKEIYYKNNRRIDNTKQLREKFLKKSQSHKGASLHQTRHHALVETPVDDVYLQNTCKPKKYSTREAVQMLKDYTFLDGIDDTSPIILKLNLKTWKPFGRSKRKKICFFSDVVDLPHPISSKNKICVFAHEEKFRKLAIENGAFISGSNDVVRKIIQNELACDKYLVTQEYSLLLDTYEDLKKKLQRKFPAVKEASDDFIEDLSLYQNSTLFNNFSSEGDILTLKIGQPVQTEQQVDENITFFFEFINEYAADKGFKEDQVINSAAISCFTEYIPLDISELVKESDI